MPPGRIYQHIVSFAIDEYSLVYLSNTSYLLTVITHPLAKGANV